MTEKLRVLIVDDHPLMRRALQESVATEPDIEVVAVAADGREAQTLAYDLHPDLILMDLLMPHSGLEAIAAIHRRLPQTHVLVITSVEERSMIVQAVQAGALGYLTKQAGIEELLAAIRTVGAGKPYLPSHIAAQLLYSVQAGISLAPQTSRPNDPLTGREQAIFNLLGQGLSNPQIAQRLKISDATVRVHIHNIMVKYGFATRGELVIHAANQQV